MTKKILLGGLAALALAGITLPATAQDYDTNTYTTRTYTYRTYTPYTVSLQSMDEAAARINNMSVEVPSGAYAGEVRSVRTNFAGEPSRIGIALTNGRWVWLSAYDLRYDPDRHVLKSRLSYDQLDDMSI